VTDSTSNWPLISVLLFIILGGCPSTRSCVVIYKLYKHREENQLDATECFIALIICSTCFGNVYAHHQKLETILVLLQHTVCNVSSPSSQMHCLPPCLQQPTTSNQGIMLWCMDKHTSNIQIVNCNW